MEGNVGDSRTSYTEMRALSAAGSVHSMRGGAAASMLVIYLARSVYLY